MEKCHPGAGAKTDAASRRAAQTERQAVPAERQPRERGEIRDQQVPERRQPEAGETRQCGRTAAAPIEFLRREAGEQQRQCDVKTGGEVRAVVQR